MIQAIYEELSRSQGTGRRPPAQVTTIPFSLRGLKGKKAMPQLLWDTMKDQIQGSTIKYSSTKKKKEMEKLKNLETLLAQLEVQYDLNDNTAINSPIRNTKQEILVDKIMEERTRGACICCRVRWYEEGEKSSKCFLNLEKRNYNNKVTNKLKDSNNQIVTDPKLILNEEKEFYKNL